MLCLLRHGQLAAKACGCGLGVHLLHIVGNVLSLDIDQGDRGGGGLQAGRKGARGERLDAGGGAARGEALGAAAPGWQAYMPHGPSSLAACDVACAPGARSA